MVYLFAPIFFLDLQIKIPEIEEAHFTHESMHYLYLLFYYRLNKYPYIHSINNRVWILLVILMHLN